MKTHHIFLLSKRLRYKYNITLFHMIFRYIMQNNVILKVAANKNLRISIGTVFETPLGGWSLLTVVSILYAPNLSRGVLI